jgi:hypothetical protein
LEFGATSFVLLIVGGALGWALARLIVPSRVRSEIPALAAQKRRSVGLQHVIEAILIVEGAWGLFSATPLVQALIQDVQHGAFVRAPLVAPDVLTQVVLILGMMFAIGLAYRVGYGRCDVARAAKFARGRFIRPAMELGSGDF